MIFSQKQVWEAVRFEAGARGFDPYLVMAICEQECEHRIKNPDGSYSFDRKQYRTDKVRLEQAFYDRYVERQNEMSTSSEALLACSWGIMQLMGLSLLEMDYFQWFYQQAPAETRIVIGTPFSQLAIPSALDYLVVSLPTQIHYGVKHLERKRRATDGDVTKMLLAWNGGSRTGYPSEVLARIPQLKKDCPA